MRESDSRRCRGTTVTVSISHRKATSAGVKPGWRGNAMVDEADDSNCDAVIMRRDVLPGMQGTNI